MARQFLLLAASSAMVIAACSSFSSEGVPAVDPSSEAGAGNEAGTTTDGGGDSDSGDTSDRDAATAPYDELIAKTKPVAYWRLEEGTSPFMTTPVDNSRLFIVSNATSVQYGVAGIDGSKAIQLDSTAKIQVSTLLPLEGAKPFSIELWLKLVKIPVAPTQIALARGFAGGSSNMALISVAADGTVSFSRAANAPSTAPLAAGGATTYHHVVAVYETDSSAGANVGATIYVDNAKGMTVPGQDLVAVTAGAFFEVGNDDAAHPFSGAVDEIAVYDKALSELAIATHYKRGKP